MNPATHHSSLHQGSPEQGWRQGFGDPESVQSGLVAEAVSSAGLPMPRPEDFGARVLARLPNAPLVQVVTHSLTHVTNIHAVPPVNPMLLRGLG